MAWQTVLIFVGVFMEIDDDEDDDIEMTMSVMEQFEYRISQMMDRIVLQKTSKHGRSWLSSRIRAFVG